MAPVDDLIAKFQVSSLLEGEPDFNEFEVTSDPTEDYNCFAWAAHDTSRCWDPDKYWPTDCPVDYQVQSFATVFESLGFSRCANSQPEPGVEKVVLFSDESGEATHAARSLPNGNWTSKLGKYHDIEHDNLECLAAAYGEPAIFLERKI